MRTVIRDWPEGERASRLVVFGRVGDEYTRVARVENLPAEPGTSKLAFDLHLEAIATKLDAGQYLAVRLFANGDVQTRSIEVEQPEKRITVSQ